MVAVEDEELNYYKKLIFCLFALV